MKNNSYSKKTTAKIIVVGALACISALVQLHLQPSSFSSFLCKLSSLMLLIFTVTFWVCFLLLLLRFFNYQLCDWMMGFSSTSSPS